MAEINYTLTDYLDPALHHPMINAYRQAFHAPPYSKGEAEVSDFVGSLETLPARAGFKLMIARDSEPDEVVGFAYGYLTSPDQYFYREVASLVAPEFVVGWLDGAFRLVEMAVLPAAQGCGIGGALHDRLLNGVSSDRAVLATMAAETRAVRLYRSRGWQVLLGATQFPGMPRLYQVMGLDLAGQEIPRRHEE